MPALHFTNTAASRYASGKKALRWATFGRSNVAIELSRVMGHRTIYLQKCRLGSRLAGRSGAVHTGCQSAHASCRIGLLLDGQASIKKDVEGFDLIKEQDVIDHVQVVVG